MIQPPLRSRTNKIIIIILCLIIFTVSLPSIIPSFILSSILSKAILHLIVDDKRYDFFIKEADLSWTYELTLKDIVLKDKKEKRAFIRIEGFNVSLNPLLIMKNRKIPYVVARGIYLEAKRNEGKLQKDKWLATNEGNSDKGNLLPYILRLPVKTILVEAVRINTARWTDKSAVFIQYFTMNREEYKINLDLYGQLTCEGKIGGDFAFTGTLLEERESKVFSGLIRGRWENIPIEVLQGIFPESTAYTIKGVTKGSTKIEITPNVTFNWGATAEFKSIELVRGGKVKHRIKWLDVGFSGSYDPLGSNIRIDDLNLKSRYTDVKGEFSFIFSDFQNIKSRLHLYGVCDGNLIPLFLPDIEHSEGPCKFDIDFTYKDRAYYVKMKINADQFYCKTKNFIKENNKRCDIGFTLKAIPENWPWMQVEKLTLSLGDLSLEGNAILPRIYIDDDLRSWLDRTQKLSEIEISGKTSKIEELISIFPALKEKLRGYKLAGPVSFSVRYAGQESISKTDIHVKFPKESVVTIYSEGSSDAEPLWIKPADPLDLRASIYWKLLNPNPDTLAADFSYKITCGDFNLESRGLSKLSLSPSSLSLEGIIETNNIEGFITASPYIKNRLSHRALLAGGARSYLKIDMIREDGKPGEESQFKNIVLKVDAANLKVTSDLFKKKEDSPCDIELIYTHSQTKDILSYQMDLSGIKGSLTLNKTAEDYNGSIRVWVTDIEEMSNYLPRLEEFLDSSGRHMSGSSLLEGVFTYLPSRLLQIQFRANADKIKMVDTDGSTIKLPTEPAEIIGNCIVDLREKQVQLSPTEINLAGCKIEIERASLEMEDLPDISRIGRETAKDILGNIAILIKSLQISANGSIELAKDLRVFHSSMEKVLQRYNLSGKVEFNTYAAYNGYRWQIRTDIDADDVNIGWSDIVNKSKGIPTDISFNMYLYNRKDRPFVHIDDLHINVGNLELVANLLTDISIKRKKEAAELNDMIIFLDILPVDLKDLRDISNTLARMDISGRFSASFMSECKKGSLISFIAEINSDNVSFLKGGEKILTDGKILISDKGVYTDSFKILVDESSLDVNLLAVGNNGNKKTAYMLCNINSPNLDLCKLKGLEDILGPQKSDGAPSHTPSISSMLSTSNISKLLEKISQLDFIITLNASKLCTRDLKTDVKYPLKDFISTTSGIWGSIQSEFWSMMNGGSVSSRISADIKEDPIVINIESKLDDIQASEELQPLIDSFFPGLFVEGKISISENSSIRVSLIPELKISYPEGKGYMLFTDGYMIGKAAPDWVTKIFPQLNFTRYDFNRMHNWFEKYKDGKVHNNMLFISYPWNIYIEGDSFADGHVEYEVGVDLLASFESEYWSSVGQGRVPIFTTRGLIKERKFVEQDIEYVPPHELFYKVFIKNNIITTAYKLIKHNIASASERKTEPAD